MEFGLPDLESRTQIFQIHTRTMNVERDIRFELLARLCPNSTGADIRSVCTEAGMFAIRNRCARTHPLSASSARVHLLATNTCSCAAAVACSFEVRFDLLCRRRKTVTEKDFLDAVTKVRFPC